MLYFYKPSTYSRYTFSIFAMLIYQQLLPDAIERVNLKRKFEQSSMAELLETTESTEELYEPPTCSI